MPLRYDIQSSISSILNTHYTCRKKRVYQTRIRLLTRKPLVSSMNNSATWYLPTSAHLPCSTKEKGATCGMSRTENTWTSQQALL
jgi:hypothetical protein